jgi:hypothetical protein
MRSNYSIPLLVFIDDAEDIENVTGTQLRPSTFLQLLKRVELLISRIPRLSKHLVDGDIIHLVHSCG